MTSKYTVNCKITGLEKAGFSLYLFLRKKCSKMELYQQRLKRKGFLWMMMI